MLIALVNDQRTSAKPKLKGLCPACHKPVTPRCGEQRAWHWAHASKKECDGWWEETEWHRRWKNLFPVAWREVIQYDSRSGEKHIADIRTEHGLVIEFQHSPLDPQERIERESFYKNMVWVVDAAHRKNDYKRFVKGSQDFRKTHHNSVFLVAFPDEVFPAHWIQSTKPVFFDFKGILNPDPPDKTRESLWCLLPEHAKHYAVLIELNRDDFVAGATKISDFVDLLRKAHTMEMNSLLLSQQTTQSPMTIRRPPIRRHFRL